MRPVRRYCAAPSRVPRRQAGYLRNPRAFLATAPGAGRLFPAAAAIQRRLEDAQEFIGKNGGVLKKVGTSARLDIAEYLGQAVYLELWVKVKSNWADNEKDLMNLGYEAP